MSLETSGSGALGDGASAGVPSSAESSSKAFRLAETACATFFRIAASLDCGSPLNGLTTFFSLVSAAAGLAVAGLPAHSGPNTVVRTNVETVREHSCTS